MLTFGSLFTGIGGIDLGLERAGWECKWQVENDDFCNEVLRRHWPNTQRYGDITQVEGKDLERVDLLAGGFPCQPVSIAGQRRGDADKRWLWPEFHRLICQLRPRWVLVENVTGLLSKGFGTVLKDLSTSGYDAEWDTVPAAAVGAPHKRDRIFLVAYPKHQADTSERGQHANSAPEGAGWHDDRGRGEGDAGRSEESIRGTCSGEGTRWYCTNSSRDRWNQGGTPAPEQFRVFSSVCVEQFTHWKAEPYVGDLVNGISVELDSYIRFHATARDTRIPRLTAVRRQRAARLKVLGNAVVPQVAEYVGKLLMDAEMCNG